jgi:hypothetical protein
LNRKPRPKAPKAIGKPIVTSGEIFPDGTVIELVGGSAGSNKPDLLLWNGTATVAHQVKHGGCVYEAPELSPSLYRAMLLPSGFRDCGPPRELYRGIAALFVDNLNFAERESRLLASFCMSSWLADRLPIAPSLVISGPDRGAGIEVLRFLGCVCRRPLLLAEVTPGTFRSLPMDLSMTLLMNQQELRPAMWRILCAASYRGLHLSGPRGAIVDPCGPWAIFGGSELGERFSEGTIQISMALSQLQRTVLHENVRKKIADDFQPRLLHFRLTNCSNLRECQVGATGFTSETRRLAYALRTCLPADPEFARDIVELLRPQDQEVRAQRLCDVSCVLIEILWGLAHHEPGKAVTVDGLAKMANALLRSRGGNLLYSAEEIGWKLRALGIARHTTASARQILFNPDNRVKIHNLAHDCDLVCSQTVAAGCPDCAKAEPIVSKELM